MTHNPPVSTGSNPDAVCFRCSPAADGSDLQEVSGLSSNTRHGDQVVVHDLQGNNRNLPFLSAL